jgi:putative RNA 2'-phosphotransferase
VKCSSSRHQQIRLHKLSRFLSLLLRHQPSRFPVRLDAQGYADLDEVLRIVQALPNFRWTTLGDLEAVVNATGHQRFEIVAAGPEARRIRALYGHSTVRPTYDPVTPPDTLYYGVDATELGAIQREGLTPPDRHHLTLTPDPAQARSAALRYASDPVVLTIDAASACAAGHLFYRPADAVYLCDHISPQYITPA